MKKTILFFCKLAISGILALAILSVLTMAYCNSPQSVAQPDKFTNNKFVSHTYWMNMMEGGGYGKTNNLGYNEQDDFDFATPMIAVLGCSHTQALEIPQNKTYTAQLQQLLKSGGAEDIDCQNFGISAHFLNVCVSNFRYFAEAFQDADVKCAVIETSSINYTPEEWEKMFAEEYHSDLQERNPLYTMAQKIPYLRLLYRQFQDVRKSGNTTVVEPAPFDYTGYKVGVDQVMEKLSGIAKEEGFPLVILYHNSITVQDRTASREDDAQQLEIFRDACQRNGILFVDVTNRFIDHYNNTFELPYGFSNTTMGTGHLNELGHRIIADELYGCVAQIMEGD